MKKILSIVLLSLTLAGCVTVKDWTPTGGSRADGVVRLSYEIGEMQRAEMSEAQGIRLATQRCQSWGYEGAEAFGGVTRQCNQFGGFAGCSRYLITKEYQCVGEGNRKSR